MNGRLIAVVLVSQAISAINKSKTGNPNEEQMARLTRLEEEARRRRAFQLEAARQMALAIQAGQVVLNVIHM